CNRCGLQSRRWSFLSALQSLPKSEIIPPPLPHPTPSSPILLSKILHPSHLFLLETPPSEKTFWLVLYHQVFSPLRSGSRLTNKRGRAIEPNLPQEKKELRCGCHLHFLQP